MNVSSVVIRRLSGDDLPQFYEEIATLHTDLIHGGVLPLLGKNFLATLYREIADSRFGSLHAATEDGKVIGFLAGTRDMWRCAVGFSLLGYLRLSFNVLLRAWHPKIIWKVCEAMIYPFRKSTTPIQGAFTTDKHRAELLAIAVSRAAQGAGVGRALVQAFEYTLRGEVSQYVVTTNTIETQSNAFYSALGFVEAGQQRHHQLLIQRYSKQIG